MRVVVRSFQGVSELVESGPSASKFSAGYIRGESQLTPVGTAEPPTSLDPLAVATFVAALLLGPFAAPFTLPLSVLASHRIRTSQRCGAGLARAAMNISLIYLVFGAAVLAMYGYVAFMVPSR